MTIPPGSHRNTCPLRALQKWLEAAPISAGPLFRPVDRHGKVGAKKLHKDSIVGIIKGTAHAAGYAVEDFAGHSLRAVLRLRAAANGASELLIMRQTGHRSLTTCAATSATAPSSATTPRGNRVCEFFGPGARGANSFILQ